MSDKSKEERPRPTAKEWRAKGEGSFVVLLATSDNQVSEELSRTFKDTGIEFLNLGSARDMILSLAERQINLVVFDPNVEELKGLDLLPVVKKLRPQVRVMVVSDDLSAATREALVKEGIIYQIQKPMKPGHLSQVISTVVTKLNPRHRA